MNPGLAIVAVLLTAVATLVIGAYGLRIARTTSDFYVAARSVSPWWNASAIGGEYLSAASFLGVAGLVLAFGVDMLWYPVGYAAGYLVLLVLVAAPLRRSGAYTLSDFAEARLESLPVRWASSLLVVLIGWLYLLPQFQGAGLTLHAVTGAPTWVGPVVVAVVVLVNVMSGGMRSITFVQAFQFWLKLTAMAVPVVFLVLAWQADGAPRVTGANYPVVEQETTTTVGTPLRIKVAEPVTVFADGVIDGRAVDGPVRLPAGKHEVAAGTKLTLSAGTPVPHAAPIEPATNDVWAMPGDPSRAHPIYATYSLLLALFFGTMGLPHVLVRFYTNPDGRAARRTTLTVLGLLGVFYLLPPVFGALGRIYTPDLLLTGRTDAVVLLLPQRLISGTAGDLLGALVTAGAFAAFLSTSSGLTVSVAGVLSQDVFRSRLRSPVFAFRVAASLAVAVPCLLALVGQRLGIATVVGLAFAVAASSFCPLLLLGIWWRRLTAAGALAGLVAGGGLATLAVLATIVFVPDAGWVSSGWIGTLLAQPAAWTMPIAFGVMVLVSLATQRRVVRGVARTMVRLHTPEALDVDRGEWHPERRWR